jgi:enoyl-CoA hydratase
MAEELVRYEQRGEAALIQIDAGKVNAITHTLLDPINAALDRAAAEAKAVALVGRPGCFSAGFHLDTMRGGGAAVGQLVGAGARLAMRLYESEQPVVLACSGHAVAIGAILLLSGDVRLGAAGEFRIGMNEVAIGLPLPRFAIDFARERLSKRHFSRATTLAEIYTPEGAIDAGFLDRVVAPEVLIDLAVGEAQRLAGRPGAAHAATKRRIRSEVLARMRSELEADMEKMGAVPA